MSTHKACFRCHETKDVAEFGKNVRGVNGLNTYCKPCVRLMGREWRQKNPETVKAMQRRWYLSSKAKGYRPAYHRRAALKRNYGLTTDQYDAMLAAQHGRCATCLQVERHKRGGVTVRLAVDHEHGTGVVRGLLCQACNRALGLLQENEATLENLLVYVQKHHGLQLVHTGE